MQASGPTSRLQAQKSSSASLGVADIKSIEVYSSQELTQNLSPDTLPNHNVTLTLGNSRLSETNLSDGPVFMVL